MLLACLKAHEAHLGKTARYSIYPLNTLSRSNTFLGLCMILFIYLSIYFFLVKGIFTMDGTVEIERDPVSHGAHSFLWCLPLSLID